MRRAGLAAIAVGALAVAVSTFLPWAKAAGFRLDLWELTGLEVVLLAAAAFVALALAGLALARGGREAATIVAAAILAGLALALAEDIRATPDELHGAGGTVATIGASLALAGAALTALVTRPHVAATVGAAAAFALAMAVGDNALQVHPEIQIVR